MILKATLWTLSTCQARSPSHVLAHLFKISAHGEYQHVYIKDEETKAGEVR